MLGTWQSSRDAAGSEVLLAHLHGCNLKVSQLDADRWEWSVCCDAGRELSTGEAPSLIAAQNAAEAELFAVHPPGGTWIHRLMDDEPVPQATSASGTRS